MSEKLTPSMEKMNFSSFQKHYVAYRLAQIPSLILNLDDSKLQLPDRSSLHMCNHFLDQDATAGIDPDVENPLIQHEQWRKFLKFEMSVPGPDTLPYPVLDKYTYMPGKYRGGIPHFFNSHKDIHNTISDELVDKSPNILALHEYSSLLKMHMTGRLSAYRKFDVIMRAILNKICNTAHPRYHFIMLPLSDTIYQKSQYMQAFSRIDQSSLKNRTDFSFFLEIHLLGLIFGETSHVDVTPSAYDEQYVDRHGSPASTSSPIKHIDEPEEDDEVRPSKVSDDDEDEVEESVTRLHSTSLFERLDAGVADRTFLILTHSNNAIIYNIGDIKAFSSSSSLFNKVLRHINTLKMSGVTGERPETYDAMDDDHFNQVVDAQKDQDQETSLSGPVVPDQTSSPEETKSTQPIQKNIKPAPTKKDSLNLSSAATTSKPTPPPVLPHASATPFMQDVHAGLDTKVASAPTQKEAHVSRAEKLYVQHMQTKLGGKTLAEHLSVTPEQVSNNSLDFMDKDLPIPAMKDSTIANYDQDYMRTMHYHDMARVLTSLVKQGMFVTDIKEETESDQFNRVQSYKIKLISTDGKQHNVVYKLPHVDEHGFLFINGVTSKMIKQQVNLPICKVSPTRVNLASNYNKSLVERTTSKANDFSVWISRYLSGLKKAGLITLYYGVMPITERVLPYEYSQIAQTFMRLIAKDWTFIFDYDERFNVDDQIAAEAYSSEMTAKLQSMELKFGTFCGTGPDKTYLFWDMKDRIHRVDEDGHQRDTVMHFVALMDSLFGSEYPAPDMVAEWTELKLLNAILPIVFVLGFEYGLNDILERIHLDYKFIPAGTRVRTTKDQIKIPFSDGTMVFSRYPLVKSLVAAGLKKFDTSKYTFASMNNPDTYYSMLMDKGIRINYLKGVTAFFQYFIDPITMDVLQHMGEPTNVRDLLLRATEMLSTMEHYPASAMQHHRMRGYERLSGTLYNVLTRNLATYQNLKNPRSTFSINPQDVFLKTMSDSTVQNVESINPVHEMKNNTQMTFSGSGGRTSQSFVVNDRQYPEDGVGIMSEATPDSGKVAMTVYTSANPRITNMRGMYDPNKGDGTVLDSTRILSVAGNLMPGLSQDD